MKRRCIITNEETAIVSNFNMLHDYTVRKKKHVDSFASLC